MGHLESWNGIAYFSAKADVSSKRSDSPLMSDTTKTIIRFANCFNSLRFFCRHTLRHMVRHTKARHKPNLPKSRNLADASMYRKYINRETKSCSFFL
jgi:hypothetical protein